MNVKSWAFAALAASVVLGATGCESSPAAQATRTPIPSAAPASPGTAPASAQPGEQPANPPQPQPNPARDTVAPPAASVPVDQKEPAPAPPVDQAPNGSGHGLCFDSNSQLARNAVGRLAPNAGGYPWVILEASNDPIEAGCDGVLSWMLVDWDGSHPGYHVLFFTNGQYLGTATSKYYGYTTVLGKTRNTVSVQYRWVTPQDALCCPSGGPTVVTYTLNGTTVTAQGQFPPNPDK
ncbi:LppP/LprE lipoprotein [Nocardia tenerifensis]|uniref:LppP/LprE lipoprotein n=1 Tax=Nocardia tenerifensis TaxID=228006 RepID=A0A318K7Q3_9NOCA|nr:LppP/LprE family lipoprotein [Nocardia tenerifensis]PXX69368.1 LppP/LprE lipoprotein [Nocardia tenerifensis]